jgi:hypothetical protein
MSDPRFSEGTGFGGGFDDQTRAEFQPGTEEGTVDPNAARISSKWRGVALLFSGAKGMTLLSSGASGFSMGDADGI